MSDPGGKFQKDLVSSISPLLPCVRLNDSRKGLEHERNPGDYIVFNAKIMHFLELKTSIGISMSVGEKKGYKIKLHQLKLVSKYGSYPRCEGWFILNFREHKGTYRVLASSLKFIVGHHKKKSITIEDCKELGFRIPEKDCVYDLRFLNPVLK